MALLVASFFAQSSLARVLEDDALTTRYSRLVRYLAMEGSQTAHSDFARIAISSMIAEYQDDLAELKVVRLKNEKRQRKRDRWAAGTRTYVDSLIDTFASMEAASSVRVLEGVAGSAAIQFERTLLPVSSMYLGGQDAFGEHVVGIFCQYHSCVELDNLQPAHSVAAKNPTPKHGWNFTTGSVAAFETGDGLIFLFSNVKDRVSKERVCLDIAKDLRTLGQRLLTVHRAGHSIDWEGLRITSDTHPPQVIVNRHNLYLSLSLPALSQVKGMLRTLTPWLQASVAEQSFRQYIPNAELLLGVLLTR